MIKIEEIMKIWHAAINLKQVTDKDYYYITVEAETKNEAIKRAKEIFMQTKILQVRVKEWKE